MEETRKYNINLKVNIKKEYNYLCYLCDVFYKVKNSSIKQTPYALIESIVIENKGEEEYKDLHISFSCSNEIFNVSDIYLSNVIPSKATKITEGIMTKVDTVRLYSITETEPINFSVRLFDKDELILEDFYDIIVTPINESSHIIENVEMLSCFVTPNIKEINEVVRHATDILSDMRKKPSAFIGYQANDIDSVREEMMAVYNALRDIKINYANPPASFNLFQSVRLPKVVLTEGVGTCLDLAILYAACLENIGLNPILIVIDGHAFTGCFLNDECFIERTCTDIGKVFNESADDNLEIELVECTMFTKNSNLDFNSANKHARDNIRLYNGSFSAIDIRTSHKSIFRPIPEIEVDEEGKFVINIDIENKDKLKKKNSENNKKVFEGEVVPDKFNYWSKKLLDLSLRNKLINFKVGPSSPQLVYDNAGKMLERMLKKDKIYLYPNDIVLEKNTYYEYSGDFSTIQSLEEKNIYKICTDDKTIKGLFRSGNSSIEETGSNNLFLSFGLINYIPKHSQKALIAPVFLVPVKGKNKRTVNGYEVTLDIDNISINTTFFEYLHQTCDISFEELYNVEKELDTVSVSSIFNAIRRKTSPECSIAVDDNKVFLSTFSFANFILWEDIHNRKEQLLENEIIKCMVNNEPVVSKIDSNFNVDEEFDPDELAIPLSADSSQIKAIALATKGESFVLDGPPGTGKSQTIVNMIINAIYSGKTVLFVAEKMAALEVVKKRIDDINLGCFCLELHSHKANKRAVLEQIEKALAFDHTKSSSEFNSHISDLKNQREYLNDFIKRIHDSKLLYSLYDAIVNYYSLENYLLDIKDDKQKYLSITKEDLRNIDEDFDKLDSIYKQYNEYSKSPFYAFDIDNYLFTLRDKLKDEIVNLESNVNVLKNNLISFKCNIKTDINYSINNVSYLIKMIELLLTEKVVFNNIYKKEILETNEDNLSAIETGIQNNEIKNELLSIFNESILELNARDLKNKIVMSNFITVLFARSAATKVLKTYLINQNTKLTKDIVFDSLNKVIKYQENEKEINKKNSFLKRLFYDKYEKLSENYLLMKEYYNNTYLFKSYLDRLIYSSNDKKLSLINDFKELSDVLKEDEIKVEKLNDLVESYNLYLESENTIVNDFKFNTSKIIFKDEVDFYEKYYLLLGNMKNRINDFEGISLYNKYFKEIEEFKFPKEFVTYYKEGKTNFHSLLKNFKASLSYEIIKEYFNDNYFIEFNGLLFDNAIRKYNELLDNYTELIVMETASRITKNYPVGNFEYAKSTLIYGLQKCIKNGGYKTTIRNIISEFGPLIRTICPCFLMSPMSAAQYLSLNNEKFDIVIFDEASQIPTAEAIGAISRGKSLVVAGDPEQMPPTTFFEANFASREVTEITNNYDDLESLIDDCLALNMTRNRLLWHYRSSHESLIAFSNNTFYDHSLYTFPTPDNSIRRVSYKYIKDAIYDDGVNKKEAEAIVKEVERRFNDPVLSKQSIGIVTFNMKQQELILNMITDLFDSNPKYNEINESNKDKLFVKNLENVQGDERDVILFSIGFGFNNKGKFHLHFGPLSLDKGERRLNVAVTRSKQEMVIFASIHGRDIDTTRTKNEGAKVLQEFLLYAEFGMSNLIVENSRQIIKEIGIEKSIQDELLKRGIDSDILVGDSKFKLNLCVKNMDDTYSLGIIIDGGTNSVDSSCRDRNSVQIKTLQNLNWNIINIYSIDYIKNKEQVIERIVKAINTKNKIIEKIDEFDVTFEKENTNVYKRSMVYAKYNPKFIINYEYLNEYYVDNKVLSEVQNIIDLEGPIAYTLLEERFKDVVGASKTGARIKRILDNTLVKVDRYYKKELNQMVFFPKGQTENNIDYYRICDNLEREITEIPACEIRNALIDILELQGEVIFNDITHILAKFFGIKTLTSQAQEKLTKLIKFVCYNCDEFITENDYLKLRK